MDSCPSPKALPHDFRSHFLSRRLSELDVLMLPWSLFKLIMRRRSLWKWSSVVLQSIETVRAPGHSPSCLIFFSSCKYLAVEPCLFMCDWWVSSCSVLPQTSMSAPRRCITASPTRCASTCPAAIAVTACQASSGWTSTPAAVRLLRLSDASPSPSEVL